MQRNNTSMFVELKNLIEKHILNTGEYKELFYYQQWFNICFEKNYSKGIIANHHMGSGKTVLAMSVIDSALKAGYERIIFIAPSSLEGNLDKAIEEYKTITGQEIDRNVIKFVRRSHTIVKNVGKTGVEELTLDTSAVSQNITTLGRDLVIIDEVHLVMQSISNGSPAMVEFYELLMNSPNIRVLFLTGTLINSHPFELAPLFNILSGSRLFPETRKRFMESFWDPLERRVINKGKLQNRIAGLVSRIDTRALGLTTGDNGNIIKRTGTGDSMFPDELETKVMKIPMTGRQIGIYMIRREKEIKENINKKTGKSMAPSQSFGKEDKTSSTYRVRTRQCSNYAPPPAVEAIYAGDMLDKEKDAAINRIMDAATPDEMVSPKFVAIDQLARKHKNQKGLIFSFFANVGGNGALGKFLSGPEREIEMISVFDDGKQMDKYKCCGYQKLKFDNDGKPLNLGPKTYMIFNGSVRQEVKDRVLRIYNDANNDHGELLPLLMVGIGEIQGLDLKSVRYVIMMEPQYVDTIRKQLFTRAIRYASHTRLEPIERNVQPYILISTYPRNFDAVNYISTQIESHVGLSADQLSKGLEFTTDEHLYKIMQMNDGLIGPFQDAVYETSIECNVIKKYIPELQCRMCAPDNRSLFTDNIKGQPPDKLFAYDIHEPDPCQEYKTEEIDAIKITINESDYYYVKDQVSSTGFVIYYHNKDNDIYEELLPSSPAYQEIIKKIKHGVTA